MINPERVTSSCAFVWLRADLTREEAQAYWRGPHSQIANKINAIQEYIQHHFSATDRGFWPVPKGVGGIIPNDWQLDGTTETRIKSVWSALVSRFFGMKGVFLDEFNVFDRVIANNTAPGGGRWWTGPYKRETGFRAMVLIRAKRPLHRAPFRKFIEGTLAPALLEAGALELRTHIFDPGGRFTQWTPDVRHDQPANRSYSAMVSIGAKDRADLERILASKAVTQTQPAQLRHCVSIHAYAVENTYACNLNGQPQPNTWD